MRTAVIFGALVALATPAAAQEVSATALKHARGLCNILDKTGLTSRPCTYSSGTIIVAFDMNPGEARVFCSQMAEDTKAAGLSLANWRLEIYSPYSGASSIAHCLLN